MIDREILFRELAKAPFGTLGVKLDAERKRGIGELLDEWEKTPNPGDLEGLAYVLASTFHESGARMLPIIETTSVRDKKPVSVDTAIKRLETAWARGQMPWVKQAYWRKDANGISWLGRGRVQSTHKTNYEKLARRFGVPLDQDPALILADSKLDAKIAVYGHIEGLWTNRKLDDFRGQPFREWRRIVNAMESADKVAGYAYAIGAALNRAAGASPAPEAPPAAPEPAEPVITPPAPAPVPPSPMPAPPVTPEVSATEAYKNRVKAVQRHLIRVGLKPGMVDGVIGHQTIGAMAAFRAHANLPGVADQIDPALEAALAAAQDDLFKPAPERSEATPEDAARKSETVEKISFASWVRRKIADAIAVVTAALGIDSQTDILGFFSGRWSAVTSKLAMMPIWFWLLLAAVAFIAWREYDRRTSEAVAVKAFRKGDIVGGDKQTPGAAE